MFDYSMREVITNEEKALFFMELKEFDNAEKILQKNIKINTDSILTYDLLIEIYYRKNDLPSLLRLLEMGIKNTGKKIPYRKLKKKIILYRVFKDLDKFDS